MTPSLLIYLCSILGIGSIISVLGKLFFSVGNELKQLTPSQAREIGLLTANNSSNELTVHKGVDSKQIHALDQTPSWLTGITKMRFQAVQFLEDRHYEEADILLKEAARIAFRMQGKNSPQLVPVLCEMANLALFGSKRYQRACDLIDLAISITLKSEASEGNNLREYLLGRRSRLVMWSKNHYGEMQTDDAAEALLGIARNITEKIQGGNHPDVSPILCHLGYIYYRRYGRWADAKELYATALRINEKHLGADDKSLAFICHELGTLSEKLMEFDQAAAYYRRHLEIVERSGDSQTKVLIGPLATLMRFYKKAGLYAEAATFAVRMVSIMSEAKMVADRDCVSHIEALAEHHFAKRAYSVAEPLYEYLVSTMRSFEIRTWPIDNGKATRNWEICKLVIASTPASSAPIQPTLLLLPKGSHCPVCGNDGQTACVRCSSCQTLHHRECWEYTGKCAIYACEGQSIAGS